jgi:hypothetical protein
MKERMKDRNNSEAFYLGSWGDYGATNQGVKKLEQVEGGQGNKEIIKQF